MTTNQAVTKVRGSRKKITMDGDLPDIRPLEGNEIKTGTISVKDFFSKQKEFLLTKKLEGLAERTLKDYINHFQYLNNWILQEYCEETDTSSRCTEKGLFMAYVGYMISQFKPATVNIRLRTLKCFLNWLHSEEIIKEDIASKLKLVKVPKDTIQPLSTVEVKKIFKILDLANYSEYRDFCMMLVMLETGIRVNEACNIMLTDMNKKIRLLTVRSETAKTREERHLPISAKTMKYLERLIMIAMDNNELYLFNSTYGGKMETLSEIKNFEKYGKRAGINHRCTPHIFRHTMAVNSVKAGMDIFTLQKLLGHSNITTTRQYIQLDTEDLINIHSKANVINNFI
jgi:integrase/recombinase XerD